jgi:hypothetical protein
LFLLLLRNPGNKLPGPPVVQQSELYAHDLLISALRVYKIQHIPDDDFFLMAQEPGMFTPGKDAIVKP